MTQSICSSDSLVWQLCLAPASIAAVLALGCSGSDTSDGQSDPVGLGGSTIREQDRSEGRSGASGRTTAAVGAAPGGAEMRGTTATGGSETSDPQHSRSSGPSEGETASGGATSGSSDFHASGGRNDARTSGSGATRVEAGGATTSGSRAHAGASAAGGASNTGAPNTGGAKASGGSGSLGGTLNSSNDGRCYVEPAKEIGNQARADEVSGYGTVSVWSRAPHQIVGLQTSMVVPPTPPPTGTLFLWPGLQPFGANFEPIDNGVLQPVLTWGPACAPVAQPRTYSTWWISGQYVNTNGSVPGYTDCNSGPAMSVNVCDRLDIEFTLSGTVWRQTVTNARTNQTVAYDIDMQNQAQNIAYFVIEQYSSAPVSEVIFTDTMITFDSADAADCRVYVRGKTDFVSPPTASSNGLQCSISQIILRAQGIE